MNNYDYFFLAFAISINVLSNARYCKEHRVRSTLTYIRNIRRWLNFTENWAS